MTFDGFPILAFFVGTIVLVMISIEVGYRLGRRAHSRSKQEKESPVSAIEGSVLALLAFILAFTFSEASNRLDARKELVRHEANTIRTVWSRSDFLPDPDRAQTKRLLREYVHARASAFQSADEERIENVIDDAERIQGRLWAMAVTHVRQDMPSDIGALYLESLNEMAAVHASRVAMGLQSRISLGVWLTLAILTMFGMIMVGYQAGVAGSNRTLAMPLLALAFACVVALISSLDQPIGGFTLTQVSQQPLIDLLSDIDSQRLTFSP
jgi:ABC-type multidrug transport system fused ATPase/permease subunit